MYSEVARLGALIVAIAIGAGVIVIVRKFFGSKYPTASAYFAVIFSAVAVVALASTAGIDVSVNYSPILFATFLGVHFPQQKPWSVNGVCQPLAAVSGLVAVFSALAWNLTAIAASLGVTGVLVYLSQSEREK